MKINRKYGFFSLHAIIPFARPFFPIIQRNESFIYFNKHFLRDEQIFNPRNLLERTHGLILSLIWFLVITHSWNYKQNAC